MRYHVTAAFNYAERRILREAALTIGLIEPGLMETTGGYEKALPGRKKGRTRYQDLCAAVQLVSQQATGITAAHLDDAIDAYERLLGETRRLSVPTRHEEHLRPPLDTPDGTMYAHHSLAREARASCEMIRHVADMRMLRASQVPGIDAALEILRRARGQLECLQHEAGQYQEGEED